VPGERTAANTKGGQGHERPRCTPAKAAGTVRGLDAERSNAFSRTRIGREHTATRPEGDGRGPHSYALFIPAFYEDKTFQEVIQWLAFYAIRGYMSENQKPPTLLDIYYRVREKVYSAIREGAWPKKWPAPSKRTVDRRVNEIASNKPKENLIMDKGCPRVIATKAGEYIPNPALYEDVAKILERSTQ